jgi:hypothetical protein
VALGFLGHGLREGQVSWELVIDLHWKLIQINFQNKGSHRLIGNTSTGVRRPLVPRKHSRALLTICTTFLSREARLCRLWLLGVARLQQRRPSLDNGLSSLPVIHRHVRVWLLPMAIPQRRYAHIHIYLDDPLITSYAKNMHFNNRQDQPIDGSPSLG